jgi:cyclic-di-GMP phosphodiesterase TipF (flagellum assembly factor)
MLRLKAAQENLSPALDLALFRRAAPVIRHFTSRGRRIGVFCAISPQSLADGSFLSDLVAFLRANPDIAGGLVAEISQPALAGLSAAGLEGLGYLAQLGATFSLSEVSTRGVELDLLSQLGFKFIDIDVQATARIHGWDAFAPDGAAAELAQTAEEAGFSVIAGNLERSEDLPAIEALASLGRGRVFSPPRIVRHEITNSAGTAAAA